jgi:hypothetical protein
MTSHKLRRQIEARLSSDLNITSIMLSINFVKLFATRLNSV